MLTLEQYLESKNTTRLCGNFGGCSCLQKRQVYPVATDEVCQIVALQCTELKERVENNSTCPRLKMEWDNPTIQYLAKTYYNPAKGARALAGDIQRTMENPIADLVVQEKIKEDDTIRFSSDGTQIKIDISSV